MLTEKIYADLSAWALCAWRGISGHIPLTTSPKSSPNSMSYMATATSPMTRRLWVVSPARRGPGHGDRPGKRPCGQRQGLP